MKKFLKKKKKKKRWYHQVKPGGSGVLANLSLSDSTDFETCITPHSFKKEPEPSSLSISPIFFLFNVSIYKEVKRS